MWRYHPVTREFELFCEGGSNCYGVTFDANGELYYSTNAGPFVHAVQGGYFYKSFGKHGPLHNLYAYHHFPELERDQVPGGPPTGGTIYLADTLPQRFRGAFIAGNFLGHTLSWWTLEPAGSTVRATYGGVLLDSHDTWFGPTDVCAGPDGSLYVSDFYDARTAHPDPDASWDRSNGRIYKITAISAKRREPVDISRLPSNKLIDLLSHSNRWYADRARVELATRRDPAVVERLRELANQTHDNQLALEALWALNVTAGLDEQLAIALLEHPLEYVRYWTIRLLGDRNDASPELAERLSRLAADEPSPVVRGQLAATAKRLPGAHGLRIADALLRNYPNEADPRIPWLIWWAIESKAMSDTNRIVEMFAREPMWVNAAARGNVLRLIRRFAAEGTAKAYSACLQLLQSAPTAYLDAAHEHLRLGLAERAVGLERIGQGGLFGEHSADAANEPNAEVRHYEPLGDALKRYIERLWRQKPRDMQRLEMALRAGVDEAYPALKSAAFDSPLDAERSARLFVLLREFGRPDIVPALLELVTGSQPDVVKTAALEVLAAHDSSEIAAVLLRAYPPTSGEVRSRLRDVLFARPRSALAFLKAVEAGRFDGEEIPLEQIRRLSLHHDEAIDELVRKHWGNVGPGSPEEKLATMRRYNNDLRAGGGDPGAGQHLFDKHCGTCHELHGKGNRIGPDLTTANRGDLVALLANLVDPSAVVRREYLTYIVVTDSGRVLTGLLAEQDAASVTVLDAENRRTKVSRDQIDELRESDVSLMPERILDTLTPQERRDLFAYLQGEHAQ